MRLLAPWGLLFAVTALVPLGALLALELRAQRIRRGIGEPPARRLPLAPIALSLALVPVLLAVAIAEPVVERTAARAERAGVEAYVVIDTSGSMQASSGPASATRLQRAKREALALRRRLPDIRFGIASMTDRTLPHLFPTGNAAVFAGTLDQSVGIERPPPSIDTIRATALDSLSNLAQGGFFTASRRLAVVFTDGESDPVTPDLGASLRKAGIRLLLVRVWHQGERIFLGGIPDPKYRPEPRSAALARAAALTGGRVFPEGDLDGLASVARQQLDAGASLVTVHTTDVHQVLLAKWFVLGALVPLAYLLWRRNLPTRLRPLPAARGST